MISRITSSRDERGLPNTQHHGVSNPVPGILGREIMNAVLLQVAKQIKIEMKKANKQDKAIQIKLNILDYSLMKAGE